MKKLLIFLCGIVNILQPLQADETVLKTFNWKSIEIKHLTINEYVGLDINCGKVNASNSKKRFRCNLIKYKNSRVDCSFLVYDSKIKDHLKNNFGCRLNSAELKNWKLVLEIYPSCEKGVLPEGKYSINLDEIFKKK